MNYRKIAAASIILLSLSLATAQTEEYNENYTGLDGYYWEFDDSYQRVTETELYNGNFSESTGYELETSLNETSIEADASIIIGLEPRENEDVNAVFSYSPARPEVGDKVEFNASRSEGDIDSYSWNINGENYSGETVEHVFNDSGEQGISLTVNTVNGEADTSSAEISVIGSETSTSSSSRNTDPETEETEDSRIVLTVLPGQTLINEPVNVAGYITTPENSQSIEIFAEGDLKANTTANENGRFSEEVDLSEVGQNKVTVKNGDENTSGLVNAKPVINIIDVDAPSKAQINEEFEICAKTDSAPENAQIKLSKDGEIISSDSDNCFELSENRTGLKKYSLTASIDSFTETEEVSVEITDQVNQSSQASTATGGFFRENAHLVLSGLGLLTLAGLAYRKR